MTDMTHSEGENYADNGAHNLTAEERAAGLEGTTPAPAITKTPTDPRTIPGAIAGPGGPFDQDGVIIDATHAVLMDSCTVAMVEPRTKDGQSTGQEPVWVLSLGGRVNRTQDQANINFLFKVDSAAAIISQLMALAVRSGNMEALDAAVDAAMETLAQEGH